jgi:hypothetical protein
MPVAFDPYHRWLGIPPKDQPANHYRLLGIDRFESDQEVIRDAAEQRMAHVRTYHLGQYSELSQRILNELAAAKACLLDPQRKAAYDRDLSPPIVPPQLQGDPSPANGGLAGPAPLATQGLHVDDSATRPPPLPLHFRPALRRSTARLMQAIVAAVALLALGIAAIWACTRPLSKSDLADDHADGRNVAKPSTGGDGPNERQPDNSGNKQRGASDANPTAVAPVKPADDAAARPATPQRSSRDSSTPGGHAAGETGQPRPREHEPAGDVDVFVPRPPIPTIVSHEPLPPNPPLQQWPPITLNSGQRLTEWAIRNTRGSPLDAPLAWQMRYFAQSADVYVDVYRSRRIRGVFTLAGMTLNGPAATLYENGALCALAVAYRSGKLEGCLRQWDENGRLILYAEYQGGKWHGVVFYFRAGKPVLIRLYAGDVIQNEYFVKWSLDGRPTALPPDKLSSSADSDDLFQACKELDQRKEEIANGESSLEKRLGKYITAQKTLGARKKALGAIDARSVQRNQAMQSLMKAGLGRQ